MSTDSNQACGRADVLREYAFDELAAAERGALEQHLAGCDECSLELDRLRLTVAALRVVPDREIPRRIAFVSDSPGRQKLAGGVLELRSAARVCVRLRSLGRNGYVWPCTGPRRCAAIAQILSRLPRACRNSRWTRPSPALWLRFAAEVKAEDARRPAGSSGSRPNARHEQERRALLVAMDENMTMLRKRLNTYDLLASAYGDDLVGNGDANEGRLLLLRWRSPRFVSAPPNRASPRRQILDVEGAINSRFRSNFADPYDLLGDCPGNLSRTAMARCSRWSWN